ncbi:disintegrin and metalloproteinase domain-containing protein 21-like [Ochotona princeps]|uniref:disintegrin and metalloproteinase domain-containing protein 21-like n=1 Tax=Ochotona princeps TaxID=9978 RepID=UPI002714A0C9|nr:disintegrin and metalloproteinase domain-containing protein 21-like [Ochotona princeps]
MGWVTFFLSGLWVLLEPGLCSPGRPMWHYAESEVVIPRKEMHPSKGVEMPGWVFYSLHFGGQRHVIHLRSKKFIWPRHLLMMTQDDQGALQMDYPYIPTDCYYFGYLEDIPLSTVTIDMCYGGLAGVMKLDDLTYEIKPLQDSHIFEHVVSQVVADYNTTGPTPYRQEQNKDSDLLLSEVSRLAAPRLSTTGYPAHIFRLKDHVQVTHGMFRLLYRNMTRTAEFVLRVFNVVDSLFKTLYGGVYLSLLTIYNIQDPVNPFNDFRVPGGAYHTYYREVFFNTMHPDASIAITPQDPENMIEELQYYTLCTHWNFMYVSYRGRHYLQLALMSAQGQGRMLGLFYDHSDCACNRRTTCVMHVSLQLTDSFSNCSFFHFQNIQRSAQSRCYFSLQYEYFNKTLLQVRCGNSEVEGNEQCDCGSFKQCYANRCCQNNCRFSFGSVCNKEKCCTNCTYSPSGTLCRPIMNPCDLPEYCTGSTITCPEDFYIQDGAPCTEEGYCYRGSCSDPSMHCKEIFGEGVHNGHDSCYEVNTIGFRFGFCFRYPDSNRFRACSQEDRKCGRLQCTNVSTVPKLQQHVSFHQSLYDDVFCFGLDEHRGTGANDVGHVRNGTPCADGFFCINSFCNGSIDELQYDCTPEKCSFRGVCNNRKNCHCHVGWRPPLCLSTGPGGSSDSGPPPRGVRKIRSSLGPIYVWRVILGRICALICVLLFGVATNVRTVKITTVKKQEIPEKPQPQ